MLRNHVIRFPTFVLICALFSPSISFGAKTTPSPDFDEQTQTQAPENADEPRNRDTLNIANPPPPKEPFGAQREYFHPYRQSITIRAGQVFSSTTLNGTSTPMIGGAQYQFTTTEMKTYEIDTNLMTDGSGSLSFSKRWNYTRSRFRPYTRAGGGLLVSPVDGLAAFVNYVNYRAEGSVGAEYLARRAQSIRVDLEAAVSMKSLQIIGTIGYVWAW